MGGFVVVLGFFVLVFVVSCRFLGGWICFTHPIPAEHPTRSRAGSIVMSGCGLSCLGPGHISPKIGCSLLKIT